MAAYAIVDLHVIDIEEYLNYQHALQPLLREVGARYLARGGEFEVLAGNAEPERLILIEFPSLDVLREFYDSPAYAALDAQRQSCCRLCVVGVKGLDQPTPPEL